MARLNEFAAVPVATANARTGVPKYFAQNLVETLRPGVIAVGNRVALVGFRNRCEDFRAAVAVLSL